MTPDRDMIFGKLPEGTYMYCMHCERTYKYGAHRIQTDLKNYAELCPYQDCNGDAVLDAREWDDMRLDHPEYPEVPEHGKIYPLY